MLRFQIDQRGRSKRNIGNVQFVAVKLTLSSRRVSENVCENI
jgi:hypothetical protein